MTAAVGQRVRRTTPPHPTESLGGRARRALLVVSVPVAASAWAVLLWGSARMEDVGVGYATMQLSGSDLPEVLSALSEVHRWVLVATLADVVFAAAFGASLVLALGLIAERAVASDRHDAASFATAAACAVGAWTALGYMAADLVENHLVLGALWRSAQGSVPAVLGQWMVAVGVVKYGLLIATIVVPLVAWAVFGRAARRRFGGLAW